MIINTGMQGTHVCRVAAVFINKQLCFIKVGVGVRYTKIFCPHCQKKYGKVLNLQGIWSLLQRFFLHFASAYLSSFVTFVKVTHSAVATGHFDGGPS